MSEIQELIAALKAIEEDVSVLSAGYLTTNWDEETDTPIEVHPKVREIIDLADEVLITNKGQCEWANHHLLKKAGYPVLAGETDSFGWLTGCIHTKKGVIVYG